MRLQEPYLADIPAEERHLQAEMSVDDVSVEALLGHPHVQVCGCVGGSTRGVGRDCKYAHDRVFKHASIVLFLLKMPQVQRVIYLTVRNEYHRP